MESKYNIFERVPQQVYLNNDNQKGFFFEVGVVGTKDKN